MGREGVCVGVLGSAGMLQVETMTTIETGTETVLTENDVAKNVDAGVKKTLKEASEIIEAGEDMLVLRILK